MRPTTLSLRDERLSSLFFFLLLLPYSTFSSLSSSRQFAIKAISTISSFLFISRQLLSPLFLCAPSSTPPFQRQQQRISWLPARWLLPNDQKQDDVRRLLLVAAIRGAPVVKRVFFPPSLSNYSQCVPTTPPQPAGGFYRFSSPIDFLYV